MNNGGRVKYDKLSKIIDLRSSGSVSALGNAQGQPSEIIQALQ
jgi:hypothetical protein